MSSTPSSPQLNLMRLSLMPYSARFSGPCTHRAKHQAPANAIQGLLLGLAVHQTCTCWHEYNLPGSPWQPGITPACLGYGLVTETS